MSTGLKTVGSTEYVEVTGIKNIPAKIDTGADSSSIWVSNIKMSEEGILSFALFGEKSPLYTGEIIEINDFTVRLIRSSHGDVQIRYKVILPLKLAGRTIDATFTLANRSRNSFPVLIGRQVLEGNFLVDVSRAAVKRKRIVESVRLNKELKDDPLKFHEKYLNNREK